MNHAILRNIFFVTASAGAILTSTATAQQQEQSVRESDQEMGKRFEFTLADLPEPYATEGVQNTSRVIARDGAEPNVPEGFAITLFAEDLPHPRQMLVLGQGVLVAQQNAGHILYLHDSTGAGAADINTTFADGFDEPYGMAIGTGPHEGHILVADTRGIWRLPYSGGETADGPAEPVTEQGVFGTADGHSTRSLAVHPETGALYVGVGSTGNILAEAEDVKATIQVFDADGSNQHTYAEGLRNPIGMRFHPDTGALWALTQERDGMGDGLVPDYFAAVQEGAHYGWPYGYMGQNPQPNFDPAPEGLVENIPDPDVIFAAHSATMDFAFVPQGWPEDWQGDAMVVLRGSWNAAEPRGYKLVRVPFADGQPLGHYENFVTGFWVAGDEVAQVWGRPADVDFLPDGSLLLADDEGGTIWRITPPSPG